MRVLAIIVMLSLGFSLGVSLLVRDVDNTPGDTTCLLTLDVCDSKDPAVASTAGMLAIAIDTLIAMPPMFSEYYVSVYPKFSFSPFVITIDQPPRFFS